MDYKEKYREIFEENIHLKPYDIDPLLDFDVITECTKVEPGIYMM